MKKDIKKEDNMKNMKKLLIKSPIILIIILVVLILNLLNSSVSSKLGFVSKNTFTIILLILIAFNILILITIFTLKHKNEITKYYKILYKTLDYTEFISIILSVLLFVFIYLACPTTVYGSSMNNTLASSDKIFVTTLFYKPKRDDIVIVDVNENYTSLDETYYIKRVVATEGDTVRYDLTNLSYGALYVNDNLVDSYITYSEYKTLLTDTSSSKCFIEEDKDEQVVPSGYSIVLGDNRQNSKDSRAIGLIHNSDIIGKAYFRYYSTSLSFGFIKKDIKY